MVSIKRLVIPEDDQGPDRIIQALQYANQICDKGAADEVVFLVPVKNSLDSGSLKARLGPSMHRALVKGEAVKLPSGKILRCETLSTLRWLTKRSVVIAVYATQNMMDKIDTLDNLVAVVALPWTATSIDSWQRTWSPQVIGQLAPETQALIVDPVVEQALKSISGVVNRAHNVLHPADVAHAKRILRILRSYNHDEPAENIRLWAIRNGWLPKAAEELEAISQKAFSLGAKPKLENPEHAEQLYIRWCDTAKLAVQ
ncbi:hypothetical protein [Pseudomonas psychrophila]|uniref:hypothetical protein n=1 Tax=Pseudomonas psychrophila TaxID=122355 RepID=UPI0037F7858F